MKLHFTQVPDWLTTIWASPVCRPNRSRPHRALSTMLYHLSIMQAVIRALAVGLSRAAMNALDVLSAACHVPAPDLIATRRLHGRHPEILPQKSF